MRDIEIGGGGGAAFQGKNLERLDKFHELAFPFVCTLKLYTASDVIGENQYLKNKSPVLHVYTERTVASQETDVATSQPGYGPPLSSRKIGKGSIFREDSEQLYTGYCATRFCCGSVSVID